MYRGINAFIKCTICYVLCTCSHFCRATLCISAAYAVMRCLCVSVRVSVTFVSCVKTNKHIKIFSLSRSDTILVFPAKRHSNTPTGTPLTWASNAGGVGRNRDSEPISGFSACC